MRACLICSVHAVSVAGGALALMGTSLVQYVGFGMQGGGLAYGTKEGKLRILRHDPRPEARTLATCQQPRGLEDELREAESIYEDDVMM